MRDKISKQRSFLRAGVTKRLLLPIPYHPILPFFGRFGKSGGAKNVVETPKNAKAAPVFAGAALVSKEKRSMDEKTWGPCLRSGPCSLPEDTYSISVVCDKAVKEVSRNCKRNLDDLLNSARIRSGKRFPQKAAQNLPQPVAKKRGLWYHERETGRSVCKGEPPIAEGRKVCRIVSIISWRWRRC